MEKSYVSMGQNVCIVCGKVFEDGTILLDKRLKNSMERYTVTGWGMCPDDKKKKDDGYIALVVCKEETTFKGSGESGVKSSQQVVRPEDADRTGVIVHIRAKVFEELFKSPAPSKGVAFIGEELANRLEEMARRSK